MNVSDGVISDIYTLEKITIRESKKVISDMRKSWIAQELNFQYL